MRFLCLQGKIIQSCRYLSVLFLSWWSWLTNLILNGLNGNYLYFYRLYLQRICTVHHRNRRHQSNWILHSTASWLFFRGWCTTKASIIKMFVLLFPQTWCTDWCISMLQKRLLTLRWLYCLFVRMLCSFRSMLCHFWYFIGIGIRCFFLDLQFDLHCPYYYWAHQVLIWIHMSISSCRGCFLESMQPFISVTCTLRAQHPVRPGLRVGVLILRQITRSTIGFISLVFVSHFHV